MTVIEKRMFAPQKAGAGEFDPPRKENLAIALGGLAGNNAFGAGFLDALLQQRDGKERMVVPSLITATSGQVYWVYRYLQNVAAEFGRGSARPLRELLEGDLAGLTPPGLLAGELKKYLPEDTHGNVARQVREMAELWDAVPFVRDYAWWWLALMGKPGRYATAFHNLLPDCLENLQKAMKEAFEQFSGGEIDRISLVKLLASIYPDRLIQPAFPDALLRDMSDVLNWVGADENKGIGVVFNAYNPVEGMEYIYLNNRARKLMGRQYGDEGSHRRHIRYLPIDLVAIRASLWLYSYGFHGGVCTLDGAYYRDVILSEACGKGVTRICAVRALTTKWIGDLPRNHISSKDLETEIAFNGAYAGERDKIMLINKLIDEKKLTGYDPIELVEIEPARQRGYFDYVFEEMSLFEEGHKVGLDRIEEHQLL